MPTLEPIQDDKSSNFLDNVSSRLYYNNDLDKDYYLLSDPFDQSLIFRREVKNNPYENILVKK